MTETRIHPDTGKTLRRTVRSLTVTFGSLNQIVQVPGWYPEDDSDSIHSGVDLAESDRVASPCDSVGHSEVKDAPGDIGLTSAELREVVAYAIKCSGPAVAIFEQYHPEDTRVRAAIEAAQAFAAGAERTNSIRDAAWDAMRAFHAARSAGNRAAGEAARSAMATASAAFLHPIAKATQVGHILGAAAHAARALELAGGDDEAVGAAHLERLRALATPIVVDVLFRYPAAPVGGGEWEN